MEEQKELLVDSCCKPHLLALCRHIIYTYMHTYTCIILPLTLAISCCWRTIYCTLPPLTHTPYTHMYLVGWMWRAACSSECPRWQCLWSWGGLKWVTVHVTHSEYIKQPTVASCMQCKLCSTWVHVATESCLSSHVCRSALSCSAHRTTD